MQNQVKFQDQTCFFSKDGFGNLCLGSWKLMATRSTRSKLVWKNTCLGNAECSWERQEASEMFSSPPPRRSVQSPSWPTEDAPASPEIATAAPTRATASSKKPWRVGQRLTVSYASASSNAEYTDRGVTVVGYKWDMPDGPAVFVRNAQRQGRTYYIHKMRNVRVH